MSDNVIIGDFITRLDIPASRVLEGAIKANLQDVLVIGHDEDGDLYFASSQADGGDVLWLIEKAKQRLMEY